MTSRNGMAGALRGFLGITPTPKHAQRTTIVRKSAYTNIELGQLVRERDEWPVEQVFKCGCTWNTAKGGLSAWHRCRACGPWAAPYRSKKKYTDRAG